jgi:aminoglycoside phosphotransferase (APT) family kinase protein
VSSSPGEIDVSELAARASAAACRCTPGATVTDVRPLPGGQSSLTFSASLEADGSASRIVLKVAPPGLPPTRNRDVLRQAAVLRALRPVRDFRVPQVLFDDSGAPPEIPPLYGMTHVGGECFEPHVDATESRSTGIAGRARHAARLLAVLHRQEPPRLGLDEPPIPLAAEVDRWERALRTVTDLTGDTTRLVRELRAAMPDEVAPRLLHGDFRLGNMLARGARVAAVIDWEIWSIGDPRLDLSWFLLCADAAWHPVAVRHHPLMPGPTQLAGAYAIAGGPAPPEDGDWFRALSLVKMTASTALIAKHLRQRGQERTATATARPIGLMLERAELALADGTSGRRL